MFITVTGTNLDIKNERIKMTGKVIISNEEKRADFQLEILFSGPLGLLDPRHPAVSEDLQKRFFMTAITTN